MKLNSGPWAESDRLMYADMQGCARQTHWEARLSDLKFPLADRLYRHSVSFPAVLRLSIVMGSTYLKSI